MVYAYVRTSTMYQKLERQIANIKLQYPNAIIVSEKFTGTTMNRPEWNKLRAVLHAGDTVVFDEVSRMSRTAQEGFETYIELFNAGVNIVFIKQPHLNTDIFREALESKIQMTSTDVDCILQGVNQYLMILARKQIEVEFQSAEQEVNFNHIRTREGIAQARLKGKQIGRAKGATVETAKSRQIKPKIKRLSKDFDGNLNDREVMELLNVARNTYYKYKAQLKNKDQGQPD